MGTSRGAIPAECRSARGEPTPCERHDRQVEDDGHEVERVEEEGGPAEAGEHDGGIAIVPGSTGAMAGPTGGSKRVRKPCVCRLVAPDPEEDVHSSTQGV